LASFRVNATILSPNSRVVEENWRVAVSVAITISILSQLGVANTVLRATGPDKVTITKFRLFFFPDTLPELTSFQ
jgi:hypothetical protein